LIRDNPLCLCPTMSIFTQLFFISSRHLSDDFHKSPSFTIIYWFYVVPVLCDDVQMH